MAQAAGCSAGLRFVYYGQRAPCPYSSQSHPLLAKAWADGYEDGHAAGLSYLRTHLRKLLASVHNDGGHYIEANGLDTAVMDAERLVTASRMLVHELTLDLAEADRHLSALWPDGPQNSPTRAALAFAAIRRHRLTTGQSSQPRALT